jgi:hypothetical protein
MNLLFGIPIEEGCPRFHRLDPVLKVAIDFVYWVGDRDHLGRISMSALETADTRYRPGGA